MAFTLIAWEELATAAGAGVYEPLDAVADQHVRVDGEIIYVPEGLTNIIGEYMLTGGALATEGALQVSSPSLRTRTLLDIPLVDRVVDPVNHLALNMHPENPIKLEANEGLELDGLCNAAQQMLGLIWLSDGAITPVTGNMFSVFFDVAGNCGANAWGNGALTFRQTLPVGRYACVGAYLCGATTTAFRFVPVGYAHRPGALGSLIANTHISPYFRMGRLGSWFEFDSLTPPTVDRIGSAAGATTHGVMDLIRIS